MHGNRGFHSLERSGAARIFLLHKHSWKPGPGHSGCRCRFYESDKFLLVSCSHMHLPLKTRALPAVLATWHSRGAALCQTGQALCPDREPRLCADASVTDEPAVLESKQGGFVCSLCCLHTCRLPGGRGCSRQKCRAAERRRVLGSRVAPCVHSASLRS